MKSLQQWKTRTTSDLLDTSGMALRQWSQYKDSVFPLQPTPFFLLPIPFSTIIHSWFRNMKCCHANSSLAVIFWAYSLLLLILLMNRQSKLLKGADWNHSVDSFGGVQGRQDRVAQNPTTYPAASPAWQHNKSTLVITLHPNKPCLYLTFYPHLCLWSTLLASEPLFWIWISSWTHLCPRGAHHPQLHVTALPEGLQLSCP